MNIIRNIYCVGRNYQEHAVELGNSVPDAPMFFSKPTHAAAYMDNAELNLPGDQGEVHYEAELVLFVEKDYLPGMRPEDCIGQMTVGIDFTLRDVQSVLKKKGHPWLLAKGFKGSALLGKWLPFPGMEGLSQTDFQLLKNGEVVQRGQIQDMIFNLQALLEFCSQHYGLGAGDVLFTGTPAGVGPVYDGDKLMLKWGAESVGQCTVKLSSSEELRAKG